MAYDSKQLTNARAALAEVNRRGLDATTQQQVLAAILTECTLYNYANPLYPWTFPLSDGYPPRELAPSTKESCGVLQQRPHAPVWWGPEGLSIADQAIYFMDVRQAVGLFLDRLVKVPRTDKPWEQIQVVQGSEFADASNYQSNWIEAGNLLALLKNETPTPTEWDLIMATPQEKTDYAKQIAKEVVNGDINGQSVADLLFNNKSYTADAVANFMIRSQVTGEMFRLQDFLGSIDRKLTEVLNILNTP